jgi:hypothetical protein
MTATLPAAPVDVARDLRSGFAERAAGYRDVRCGSLRPTTTDACADWLGMATLGLDPDNQAEVPRW